MRKDFAITEKASTSVFYCSWLKVGKRLVEAFSVMVKLSVILAKVRLKLYLAVAAVPHGAAEPEDVPPQVAVLPDQVIAAARALAQALGVLGLSRRRHRSAGGEVRVEQEAVMT